MIWLLQSIVAADLGNEFAISISAIPYPLQGGARQALEAFYNEEKTPGHGAWANPGYSFGPAETSSRSPRLCRNATSTWQECASLCYALSDAGALPNLPPGTCPPLSAAEAAVNQQVDRASTGAANPNTTTPADFSSAPCVYWGFNDAPAMGAPTCTLASSEVRLKWHHRGKYSHFGRHLRAGGLYHSGRCVEYHAISSASPDVAAKAGVLHWDGTAGVAPASDGAAGLLTHVRQRKCGLPNFTTAAYKHTVIRQVPYFFPQSSARAAEDSVLDAFRDFNTMDRHDVDRPCQLWNDVHYTPPPILEATCGATNSKTDPLCEEKLFCFFVPQRNATNGIVEPTILIGQVELTASNFTDGATSYGYRFEYPEFGLKDWCAQQCFVRGLGPLVAVQGDSRCFCGVAVNLTFAHFVSKGGRRLPINSSYCKGTGGDGYDGPSGETSAVRDMRSAIGGGAGRIVFSARLASREGEGANGMFGPAPKCPMNEVPDGTLHFDAIESDVARPLALDFTLALNTDINKHYHRENSLSRIPTSQSAISTAIFPWMVFVQGRVAMEEMVMSAFAARAGLRPAWPPASALNRNGSAPQNTLDPALSATFVVSMPEEASTSPASLIELFGAVLYPLALTLQLPVYLFIMVYEKESRLREMQRQHGLRDGTYVGITFALNFSFYLALVAFFWIAGAAIKLRFFTQTSPALIAVLLVGYGINLNSLAFFLAAFINSGRTATICGYMSALFGVLISVVFADGIYGNLPVFSTASTPPWLLLFAPIYPIVRAVYLITFECVTKLDCPTSLPSLWTGDELAGLVLALYLNALLYMVLAWYFDAVLPRMHGPTRPCLLCLNAPAKRIVRQITQRLAERGFGGGSGGDGFLGGELTQPILGVSSPPRNVDVEVSLEVDAAVDAEHGAAVAALPGQADGSSPQRLSVLTVALRKEFGSRLSCSASIVRSFERCIGALERGVLAACCGSACGERFAQRTFDSAGCVDALKQRLATHVAVNGISLAVPPGQCFGLLGSNGAGKSTLINVLTGLLPATEGVARVAGFDVATHVRDVYLSIGVCPQHELLWPTLTVMEHLAFYSRVKGVGCRAERAALRALVSAVGLAHVRNDRAANLSGGMKRRLSIAIALAGESKVLFLDEPSTGLDPASRRQTWNVIDAAKRAGRTMVLTTHLMDEAEVLCDRLAIVEKGTMRAIGTLGALKRAHGGGFLLDMNYSLLDSAQSRELEAEAEAEGEAAESAESVVLDAAARSKLEEVEALVAMGAVKQSVYDALLAEHSRPVLLDAATQNRMGAVEALMAMGAVSHTAYDALLAENHNVPRCEGDEAPGAGDEARVEAPHECAALIAIITGLFAGAEHLSDDAFPGFSRFRLPAGTVISDAFATMETHRAQSAADRSATVVQIDAWAITQAGLDDIFTAVVEGASFGGAGSGDNNGASYVPVDVPASGSTEDVVYM